jgi:hypothetical protein
MMYLSTRRVGAVINAANAHYKMTFKGLKEGLKESGELVLRESRKIVPIDTKALYNSSRTYQKGRGYATINQIVEYRMPYALYQHENLFYKHKPGKSAKYLERPLRSNSAKIASIIKRRAQKR